MVVNRPRSLLVALVFLVCGACTSESASTSSAPAALTTFGTSTTADIAPTTQDPPTSTAAQATTTPPIALPVVPNVSTGWSVAAGDLLVANGSGVHVVRDGVTVANPVTSPVESAFADGSGGIVILTPDADRYPNYWPDPYSGGGRVVWRVSPNGSAQALYTSDAPEGNTWGTLNLYQVDVVAPVSEALSVIFTSREPFSNEPYSWDWDRVWVLPLDGTAIPTLIPAETPGEGGVTGLGWQQLDDRLLMSTESDGGASLSLWSSAGDPLEWPTNPMEGEDAHLRATTIPGTTLIAFAEGRFFAESVDLVIFDTETGTAVGRIHVIEADRLAAVKMLHANSQFVAVSWIRIENGKWTHQPVLIYNLATGTITELTLVGVATLVG
jgi:hypothetical protein